MVSLLCSNSICRSVGAHKLSDISKTHEQTLNDCTIIFIKKKINESQL